MTLLITVFAAVVSTLCWYLRPKDNELHLKVLVYLFVGASLMWFVDAVVEYIEIGSEYFNPSIEEMANDTFLGLSVVALALVIWIVVLLVKDPRKKFYKNNG